MVHHTMATSSAPASNASSTSHTMSTTVPRLFLTAMVVGLASCAAVTSPGLGDAGEPLARRARVGPGAPVAPVEDRRTAAETTPAAPGPAAAPGARPLHGAPVPTTATDPEVRRPASNWVAARWSELPGWPEERAFDVWPALLASCARPAPGWAEVCARALLAPPAGGDVRGWVEQHLQAWRVEAADGQAQGLLTGYFEPTLMASRRPRGAYKVPLHAPPPALAARSPFFTRQQLDTDAAARASLRGHEIAWIEDPLDAVLLQVQGSGRLHVAEPDGRLSLVRLAYAGHNGHAFRSLGRWLVERGELAADSVSWPAIKAWAQRHPRRVQELLWANPRVVFFREEPLPDPAVGPRGSQGVALTPGRSVAVDPQSIPYGSLLWLDSTEPLSSRPSRRLVMAQDSGSAIVGAVRADFFWGWQPEAEVLAGRTRQPLRLWALWPRGQRPPEAP